MTDFRLGRSQVIPPVIKNLIILNVIVFLIQKTMERTGSGWMENFFALHDIRSIFLQASSDCHLYVSAWRLWAYFLEHADPLDVWKHSGEFLGTEAFSDFLYRVWYRRGPASFAGRLSGIEVGLYDSLNGVPIHEQLAIRTDPRMNINKPTLGASGAIFGCMVAFGLLFPNSLVYIYFLIPVKAKWVVLAYVVYELFLGVQNNAGDNVAHWAHLGGGLVGLLLVFYWRKTDRKNFY